MPQSYGSLYLHIVFSTYRREHILTPQLHTEFSRYITPILNQYRVRLIAEGGVEDHVHLLIDLGREVSVATMLREIKSKSSSWLKKKTGREFSWQGGYGYFSVSPSHIQNVIHYIDNQKEHHRQKTFQEEFEDILSIAGVQFEPKYLWTDESD